MRNEDFRQAGHRLVDWMADYLESIGSRPVTPDISPGAILDQLPPEPPEIGEPVEQILADLDRVIMPGMAHWGHPGWFAYFPANTSPPSILAEMAVAALGAQCMSWETSPAATELEQRMMEWLASAIGLPAGFTGTIQDTASSATLVALLAARDRQGTDHGRLVVYASAEAHISVRKGHRLAGFHPDYLRLIATDNRFAMDPRALTAAIEHDRLAGLSPTAVVATVGTTSSTAIDPLRAIGEVTRREGVWLHVDAAYAGSAAIAPEFRSLLDGVEYADSFVFNPHKWLMVNFDCSAFYVRDVAALLGTFATDPAYLRTGGAGVVNYRDWGIPLGRRFRALKLWFVLRNYGLEGLRGMIRHHVALAREFAEWVDQDPGFERAAPAPLGLVCVRVRLVEGMSSPADDHLTRRVHAALNATREVHLTLTELGGRPTIRMVVGTRTTEREHVWRAWELLRDIAREERASLSSAGR